MAAGDIELPIREPRGSRRRPDLPPPKVERIRPHSGLSRAEVIADQRRRILDGLAAALASHLSGRLLAGEADRLPELHDVLLQYLLAPFLAAMPRSDDERLAQRG